MTSETESGDNAQHDHRMVDRTQPGGIFETLRTQKRLSARFKRGNPSFTMLSPMLYRVVVSAVLLFDTILRILSDGVHIEFKNQI